ncbi:putative Zn peptidase [Corynebacterium mustelae]|uniref:Putative Zn peptidase n=1 Tax=Corynebacterium mustelae TaxID=571915 RepID=A0A0G3GVI7_9CORY|nr:ImmA/IrrE family metallo-endopeptidase [Corynebacterium mustelae]AKK04555.1 putative Zn peptidase [Corynebacterium mustelae]
MDSFKLDSNGEKREVKTYGDLRKYARQDAAELLKSHWGDSIPVDPVKISRRLGVSVFTAQLGDDVYGQIIGSSAGADIYIDEDQPHPRFRFTCAHELGHYVDRSINGNILKPGMGYIDKRSEDDPYSPDEVYANEFAASLLMPEKDFKDAVECGVSDFDLAKNFEVSLSAVQWRKKRLGIS